MVAMRQAPMRSKVDSFRWADALDVTINVLHAYSDEKPIRAICQASMMLKPLWTKIRMDQMSPNLGR